ncbi:hypothetical protein ACFPTY_19885 [Halomonas beimenensis]
MIACASAGVQDVVIVEDAATAYLKVDRQKFDEGLLAGLAFVGRVTV